MFDSLDEQMKKDEDRVVSNKDRIVKWTIVVATAVVICGGLIIGVHLLN